MPVGTGIPSSDENAIRMAAWCKTDAPITKSFRNIPCSYNQKEYSHQDRSLSICQTWLFVSNWYLLVVVLDTRSWFPAIRASFSFNSVPAQAGYVFSTST